MMTAANRPAPLLYVQRSLFTLAAAMLALSTTAAAAAEPQAATVRLVIDFGDGVETHFTALPWREGSTVLTALAAAQTHRRGVAFTQKGAGSTAMITKIGDLKNEGDGKNWMFYVNGKVGEVSAGISKLKAGDTVLWRFKTYDYNSDS